MKYAYTLKKLCKAHRRIVDTANEIIAEWRGLGFATLTLRQLYYQFVSRDVIPNTERSYKSLGKIIGDGRLCGLIDWEVIEDRTRHVRSITHFDGPADALRKVSDWYWVDLWKDQPYYPEVWIEKDALANIIEPVCQENDVPYLSCRGYTSLSEMWRASMRLTRASRSGKIPYVIHFGDHDPSGIDMSRDILSRLQNTFMADVEFKRVALNMEQIEAFNPPPNPAKVTDSRYEAYVRDYGEHSWELDALNPVRFREIIEGELDSIRDQKQWDKDVKARASVQKGLVKLADRDWSEINKFLNAKKVVKKKPAKKSPKKRKPNA